MNSANNGGGVGGGEAVHLRKLGEGVAGPGGSDQVPAVIPNPNPVPKKKPRKAAKGQGKAKKVEGSSHDILVWKPSPTLTEGQVDDFVAKARDRFNYREEQALGLLLWHEYDVDKAARDLLDFTPHDQVNWTMMDKVIYQNAFNLYGNNLGKIRDYMSDKPMAVIVDYYYQHQKELQRKRKDWKSQN